MNINEKQLATIQKMQKSEITEYYIYSKIIKNMSKDNPNREVLEKISNDELKHYEIWKEYTGESVSPDRVRVFIVVWMAKILGLTFTLKWLENNEKNAQDSYKLLSEFPQITQIIEEETQHEKSLIALIKEKRLAYVGSIVLGLNDALIELTGAVAGLTLAIGNSKLIGIIGAITGISAAMSMAAAEYLSTKSEKNGRSPVVSSIYTGVAYIFTVIILVFPFFVLSQSIAALIITMILALIIIAAFSFYIGVAQDKPFWPHFNEMAIISIVIAILSFFVGLAVNHFFQIQI